MTDPLGSVNLEDPESVTQAFKDQQDELERLRKHNQELLGDIRKERVQALQAKYPGISPELVGDLPTDRVEAILKAVVPAQAPVEPPKESEKPPIPPEEQKAFEALAQAAGGGGAAVVKKITFAEAKALPWDQRREAIRKGLVEGVTAPK